MNSNDPIPKKEQIQVPREPRSKNESGGENIPPEGRRTLDEDLARDQRGLVEGSEIAEALHDRPPEGNEQLTTGSGGDAARPGKEGVFGKPIPPRGNV